MRFKRKTQKEPILIMLFTFFFILMLVTMMLTHFLHIQLLVITFGVFIAVSKVGNQSNFISNCVEGILLAYIGMACGAFFCWLILCPCAEILFYYGYWQNFTEMPEKWFLDYRHREPGEYKPISMFVYVVPVIAFTICTTMLAVYPVVRCWFLSFTGILRIQKKLFKTKLLSEESTVEKISSSADQENVTNTNTETSTTNVPIKNSDIRHPPFCIFIRYLNRLLHQEIFDFLNIKVVSAFETLEEGFRHKLYSQPCIFIAQDEEWLHIIDPVYYLYYVPNIRKQMAELGREYDIYYYALGDADYAHDFTYYKNGVKVRDFAIQDNWGQGKTIITTNEGLPFFTELLYTTNAMRRTSLVARVFRLLKMKVDEDTYVLEIAKEIGIDTHYNNLKMQAYEIEKTQDGNWEIS